MDDFRITSSVVLRPGMAALNGSVYYKNPGSDVAGFTKEVYKELKTDYPKFFKMDNLSKLAFVSVELLLKTDPLKDYDPGDVALIFSNAGASLDTDKEYFSSVEDKQNYFPSPALFVYTLPNIMMGEICIRHKITGENTFFISEHFDAELISGYATHLLSSGKARCVIAGWVEVYGSYWESSLFLIERVSDESKQILSPIAMEELYRKKY